MAWETNSDNIGKFKRWKLISKLGEIGLLIDEKVINILFEGSQPKDWEIYLGNIVEYPLNQKDEFYELWYQINGDNTIKTLNSIKPNNWVYVNRLLDIILNNKDFISGDLLTEPTEEETDYLVFAKNRFKNINLEKKSDIDHYIENLLSLIENDIVRLYFLNSTKIAPDEIDYLNEEFDSKVKIRFPKGNFLKHLIENHNEYENFLASIIESKYLKFTGVKQIGKNNETLIQLLAMSDISKYRIYRILNFIYSKGYSKNQYDDEFFLNNTFLETDAYLITYFYYKVNDWTLTKKVAEVEKELFTIFSIKHSNVVGFRFTKLIQVANNALEHYRSFNSIIMKAIHYYNRYEELSQKESFNKKVNSLKNVEQDNSFDYIFKSIFPELFPITIPSPKHPST